MQLNSFVLRLAILFLPGLLGSKLYRKLRGKTDKQAWEDLTEILLFSLASYIIFFAAASGCRRVELRLHPSAALVSATTQGTEYVTLQSFTDEKTALDWRPIAWASTVSVVVAFVASFVSTRQLVNRVGYKVGATRRSFDASIWTLFNRNYAPPSEFQWASVRDSKANVIYLGQIRHFSDPGELHELVMHDVSVYTNEQDSKLLYECGVIYIAREAGELSIEFMNQPANNLSAPQEGKPNEQAKPD
jgi:hypothetical protein